MKRERDNTTKKEDIRASVLARIHSESVHPIPKVAFIVREYVVWALYLIAVGIGAMAISIFLYAHSYMQFEPFAAITDSYTAYVLTLMPLLWLFVLCMMVLFAYINMRATRRGYRYPLSVLLGSSVLLSLLLGGALHKFGFSYTIERVFDQAMPLYPSHEDRERALWLAPHDGRLIGSITGSSTLDNGQVMFMDTDEGEWLLAIQELADRDRVLLSSGDAVRLVGIASSTASHFHVCGVFPWLYDVEMPRSSMEIELREFIERVYSHQDTENNDAKGRAEAIEGYLFSSENTEAFLPMGLCADAAVTKRLTEHRMKTMR